VIHGSSKDPVLVKKIYLKIWTLRSEVDHVVQKLKESNDPESVQTLKNEYKYKGPLPKEAGLTLISGGAEKLDAEAEMAAAMKPEEKEDQATSEEKEDSSAKESNDSEKPLKMAKVIQRSSDSMPEASIHHGTCVLSEVSMNTIDLFTSQKFMVGQSIVIEFQVPKPN